MSFFIANRVIQPMYQYTKYFSEEFAIYNHDGNKSYLFPSQIT
jgi:hypothetical protein